MPAKLYIDPKHYTIGATVEFPQLGLCRIEEIHSDGVLVSQHVAAHFRPTHVGVLIDESGSMLVDQSKTIASFNEYVETLKSHATNYRLSLATFSAITGVKAHYTDRPVGDVGRLTTEHYRPEGGTPLYDALAATIRRIEERAGRDPVIIVVMTDGEENASTEYPQWNPGKIRSLIRLKQDEHKWAFVFLGADLTREQTSRLSTVVGAQLGNTVSYNKADVGRMMRQTATATQNYAQGVVGSANVFGRTDGLTDTATLDELPDKAAG